MEYICGCLCDIGNWLAAVAKQWQLLYAIERCDEFSVSKTHYDKQKYHSLCIFQVNVLSLFEFFTTQPILSKLRRKTPHQHTDMAWMLQVAWAHCSVISLKTDVVSDKRIISFAPQRFFTRHWSQSIIKSAKFIYMENSKCFLFDHLH